MMKGSRHSEEAKAKIAKANRERPRVPPPPCPVCGKPRVTSGPRNYRNTCGDPVCKRADYKRHPRRDDVGYMTAHGRIWEARGRASEQVCVDCGGPAAQWSFRHDTPPDRVRYSPGGNPFSVDVWDYDPRCVSCHRIYDLAAEGDEQIGVA